MTPDPGRHPSRADGGFRAYLQTPAAPERVGPVCRRTQHRYPPTDSSREDQREVRASGVCAPRHHCPLTDRAQAGRSRRPRPGAVRSSRPAAACVANLGQRQPTTARRRLGESWTLRIGHGTQERASSQVRHSRPTTKRQPVRTARRAPPARVIPPALQETAPIVDHNRRTCTTEGSLHGQEQDSDLNTASTAQYIRPHGNDR